MPLRCGDGRACICAGLMDIMTDDEAMAVVGHEIGHVIPSTDSKDVMKNAYLRSAVKNAAGAASSTVSKLSDSVELGAMAEALQVLNTPEAGDGWMITALNFASRIISIRMPCTML